MPLQHHAAENDKLSCLEFLICKAGAKVDRVDSVSALAWTEAARSHRFIRADYGLLDCRKKTRRFTLRQHGAD